MLDLKIAPNRETSLKLPGTQSPAFFHPELVHFENAKRELQLATNVDEVKDLRDKAEALRLYMKQAGESLWMQNQCAEIKVRAERRAGELLKATVKPGNPQLSHDVTIKTLPDGISRKQSSRWRETPGRGDRGFHLGKRGALDIMLAFSPTRAYQENEPARCANTRQALTTQYRRY